jgi:hypothetical protein
VKIVSAAGPVIYSGDGNLCKTYHTNGVAVEALRGVDLQVAPAEFVAVVEALVPAYRAGRVSVVDTLRYE